MKWLLLKQLKLSKNSTLELTYVGFKTTYLFLFDIPELLEFKKIIIIIKYYFKYS